MSDVVGHQWWCGGEDPCACTEDWKHYQKTGEKPVLLRFLEIETDPDGNWEVRLSRLDRAAWGRPAGLKIRAEREAETAAREKFLEVLKTWITKAWKKDQPNYYFGSLLGPWGGTTIRVDRPGKLTNPEA